MPDPPPSLVARAFRFLRSKLGQYDAVREASWLAGSLLHHTLPRIAARSRSKLGLQADYTRGEPRVPWSSDPETAPLCLRPATGVVNPVLTARDVTDFGGADGVADPFVIRDDAGKLHMFMEVYNRDRDPTAAIGHATSSDRGETWEYDAIVLAEDAHLSFPYVFEWEGTRYMIPDYWDRRSVAPPVTLYEARDFPDEWVPAATIVAADAPISDVVVFRWGDRWWAIGGDERNLRAYYSSRLRADDWTPHGSNPVVSDRPRGARPGGRPLVRDDYVFMPFQDCAHQYGDKVRAFAIRDLSPDAYEDEELSHSPILEGSGALLGWDSGKKHHVDAWRDDGKWRCAVDGNIGPGAEVFGTNWAIGMYESVGRTDASVDEDVLRAPHARSHAR